MAGKYKVITIKHTTEAGTTVEVYRRPIETEQAAPWPVKNTDDALIDLNFKIRRIFREAQNDLAMKQMDFLRAHEKRVEKYQAQVKAGLLTKKDFDAWMRGQLFQERQWELKRGQMARIMTNLDKEGMKLVNAGKLDIFAENADHMLFQIETGRGISTPFGLFNKDAVMRLILENPQMLPMGKVNESKDYEYYNEIIQNSVIQGILQGETLKEIARRVSWETGEKGVENLMRNARTAYTGAQNAGALYSMRRARDELGLRIQKRWMATLDKYTRASHSNLDGQVRDLDVPFDSLLGPIMYPGDMSALPENVWNCRCYMDEYYPDYKNTMYRYDEEGNFVGDITYEEWRQSKAA